MSSEGCGADMCEGGFPSPWWRSAAGISRLPSSQSEPGCYGNARLMQTSERSRNVARSAGTHGYKSRGDNRARRLTTSLRWLWLTTSDTFGEAKRLRQLSCSDSWGTRKSHMRWKTWTSSAGPVVSFNSVCVCVYVKAGIGLKSQHPQTWAVSLWFLIYWTFDLNFCLSCRARPDWFWWVSTIFLYCVRACVCERERGWAVTYVDLRQHKQLFLVTCVCLWMVYIHSFTWNSLQTVRLCIGRNKVVVSSLIWRVLSTVLTSHY